jgi:hypothetical protein
MNVRRHFPRILIGAVILSGLVTSGCSSGNPTAGPKPSVNGGLTASQVTKEYLVEMKKLPPLPRGRTIPPPNYRTTSGGKSISYGVGIGTNGADFAWICQWEGVVLADPADSTAYSSNLKSLEKLKTLYVYRSPGDERSYINPILKKAELGDTSGLSTDYSANCLQHAG